MVENLTTVAGIIQELRIRLQDHAVRLTMRGESMIPAVQPGEKVTIVNKLCKFIFPGEIILFSMEEKIILHRVIYREEIAGMHYFLTRGDNCDVLDDWVVPETAILGVACLRPPGDH